MIATVAFVALVRPDSVSAYNLLDTITPDPAMGGSIRDALVDTKHHRLFTAESNTNRVLIYNLTDANELPDKSPDNVIGQQDFSSKGEHLARNGLNCFGACGLDYDTERDLLFVSDGGNCRVLIFDLSSGVTNGMDALYVIGQPDFTSRHETGLAPNGLSLMSGDVVYDIANKRLFVSDELRNHRVVVYDLNSLANFPAASYVLGLPNYMEISPPARSVILSYTYDHVGYPNANGLALDVSSQRLFVSDQFNSYVIVFNVSPGVIKNTNIPDYSLGYHNVYSREGWPVVHWTIALSPNNTSRNNAVNVSGLGFDQDRKILYMQRDLGVGIYDVAEVSNGEDAAGHHGGTNRQSVGTGFDPINRRLYVPFNDGKLYIYEYAHIIPVSLPDAQLDEPYSQTIPVMGAQGALNVGIVSGQLPPGLVIDSSGYISGYPTVLGGYTFSYRITDDNGDNGVFTDTKSFTINVVEPQAQGNVLGNATDVDGQDEKLTDAQSQIGQSKPSPSTSKIGDDIASPNTPSGIQIAATIVIAAAIVMATLLIIHRMRAKAKV